MGQRSDLGMRAYACMADCYDPTHSLDRSRPCHVMEHAVIEPYTSVWVDRASCLRCNFRHEVVPSLHNFLANTCHCLTYPFTRRVFGQTIAKVIHPLDFQ